MTVALTFAIVQNGMPMKFVDLISYYHIPYVSEKGIAIWKINSEIREEENIPGIDSHAILFVVGGSMEISVQGKIQSLTRGYFVRLSGYSGLFLAAYRRVSPGTFQEQAAFAIVLCNGYHAESGVYD